MIYAIIQNEILKLYYALCHILNSFNIQMGVVPAFNVFNQSYPRLITKI